MFKKKYNTEDVFGQSRELPLNYVERDEADKMLIESLYLDKHLVIYGSSKQGKTSLRKHNLNENEYIIIHCSNKWDIGKLNSQILKQAGFQLEVSSSKTLEGKAKVSASVKIMNLFDGGAEVEGGKSSTKEFKPLELDPYDSNDIIDALESISLKKFIIIEDFHYLKEETQKDFAFELKAFHENSKFTFIIIGVWLEQNRLTLLNGDLAGRIYSINADTWSYEQLESVMQKGEELLNIKFSDKTREDIHKWNIGSVFIFQELCQKICFDCGIEETADEFQEIESSNSVFILTEQIINQQTGRYNAFLQSFYYGFQENELKMHRWLLYPILTASTEQLLAGLSYRTIKEKIRSKHPKSSDLNLGNLTTALQSTHSLQIKKNIKPNIVDYDQTNSVLNIVDKGFIAWLIFQDNSELLQKYELPNDTSA